MAGTASQLAEKNRKRKGAEFHLTAKLIFAEGFRQE
jgi:hypothetical protein